MCDLYLYIFYDHDHAQSTFVSKIVKINAGKYEFLFAGIKKAHLTASYTI